MKCKGLLLLALMFVFCVSNGMAQSTMTDQQVLEYGKNALAAGKSKETIAKELVAKGVTRAQAKRVKELYEKSARTASVVNEKEGSRAHTTNPMMQNAEDLDEQNSVIDEGDVNEGLVEATSEVFGRNVFRNQRLNFAPSENLATPRNYRLGPGDEVIVDIFGANQTTLRSVISPEGSINVDILGPVYLNGMNIEEANAFLKKKLASIYAGIKREGEGTDIR